MTDYDQLTETERYQIKVLLDMGYKQKKIAEYLSRSPSTICRELNRNTGKRGYRPKQAQEKMINRRVTAEKYTTLTPQIKDWIKQLLKLDLSPEQISGPRLLAPLAGILG